MFKTTHSSELATRCKELKVSWELITDNNTLEFSLYLKHISLETFKYLLVSGEEVTSRKAAIAYGLCIHQLQFPSYFYYL